MLACFSGYTHTAEQVVLQVEGDIAVLLDGAENLDTEYKISECYSFIQLQLPTLIASAVTYPWASAFGPSPVQSPGKLGEDVPPDRSSHHRRRRR